MQDEFKRTTFTLTILGLSVSALLLACSGDDSGPATHTDAGHTDSSTTHDAGHPASDSGTPDYAGHATDSGHPATDAGQSHDAAPDAKDASDPQDASQDASKDAAHDG